jgi:hypothetical protein
MNDNLFSTASNQILNKTIMQKLLKAAYRMRQLQATPIAEIDIAILRQIQFYQLCVDEYIRELKSKIDFDHEIFYQDFFETICKVREQQEMYCTYAEFKADSSYFRLLSWLDTLLYLEFELQPDTVSTIR